MKNNNRETETNEESERKKLIDEPGLSWKKWARQVLLKYWYIFFCMLLDLGLPVQFIENYEFVGSKGYYEMLLSIIIIPFLIVAEGLIYRKLFPKYY